MALLSNIVIVASFYSSYIDEERYDETSDRRWSELTPLPGHVYKYGNKNIFIYFSLIIFYFFFVKFHLFIRKTLLKHLATV